MGIFLNFTLAPTRISPSEWEQTYEDALKIADKCDLLDKIIAERNGVRYAFSRKTTERIVYDKGLGFAAYGTLTSGYNMEDFALFRSLDFYQNELNKPEDPDNGVDILLENWYSDDVGDFKIPRPNHAENIWGGKTQGDPAHMVLLAIACLFADRFPKAVTVSGDITAGQCNAAVRLVRECLGIDIQPPVRCRPDALSQRIRSAGIPEQHQLDAFFSLYLGSLTGEVGEILSEAFGEEMLYQHFRNKMAKNHEKGYRIDSEIKDYLLLHLDFANLLRMMVSDEEGCQMTLDAALTMLFSYNIHVPRDKKECDTPLPSISENGDSEAVGSVYGLLGRAFFSMIAGRNKNLPVYVPLSNIRAACRPLDKDSDALIDRLLQGQEPDERQEQVYGNGEDSIMNQMRNRIAGDIEREEENSKYDISRLSDCLSFQPGMTIEPSYERNLVGCLRQVREFDANGEGFGRFCGMDREEREKWFMRQNCYALLRETVWNHIFEHIMENGYIHRYFLIFLIDCSYQRSGEVFQALMCNPELTDILWEKSLEPAESA